MIYLTVRYPTGKTSYHTLKANSAFIGSHAEAQLRLEDQNVSDYHAHIFFENDLYWCEDGHGGQPSKNGTWINGKRVEGAVPLEKGDNIFIGTCHISVTQIERINVGTRIPILKKQRNLTEQDFHNLQIKCLERKIKIQSCKIVLGIGLLIFLCLISFWVLFNEPMSVSVIQVRRLPRIEKKIFLATAELALDDISLLEAPLSGEITWIYRQPGEKVKQGEALLRIDNGKKITYLTSSKNGNVESYQAFSWKVGNRVKRGVPMCFIVDTSSVRLVFSKIPENQLPWNEKQTISGIVFEKIPGRTFNGTIERIEFLENKHQVQVSAVLANPQGELRPGMNAHIEYHPTKAQFRGFVIPEACLVSQNPPAVYLVQNKHCFLKKVIIEKRHLPNQKLLISRGLQENDLVILRPPENLRNGQLVNIRNRN